MNPEEIVGDVEAAYQSQDLDRVLQLFDPEVVAYFHSNGKRSRLDFEELRTWHAGWLPNRKDFNIRKTLRAVSGDTLAVEWHSTFADDDGTPVDRYGGEFWKMRNGRLVEWRAYFGD